MYLCNSSLMYTLTLSVFTYLGLTSHPVGGHPVCHMCLRGFDIIYMRELRGSDVCKNIFVLHTFRFEIIKDFLIHFSVALVAQEMQMYVGLFSPNLSKAHNLHLSFSGLSSVSGQSNVSLSSTSQLSLLLSTDGAKNTSSCFYVVEL